MPLEHHLTAKDGTSASGERRAPRLVIQIPCYNEEQHLARTVADLPRALPGVGSIEYLVVDDGSSDRTAEVARVAGVHHVVRLPAHKGLARTFMEGILAALRCRADIIVNTDADNQYRGEDVRRLVAPILEGSADIVIGERPILRNQEFSLATKLFQKVGSWVVRLASGTKVSDAPSGFRAFSRHAAMQMNVFSDYTYTLETIIQAGHKNLRVLSVPVETNPRVRDSRLIDSTAGYIFRSALTIIRIFVIYKPLRFFATVGALLFGIGLIPFVRFLYFFLHQKGTGNIQSLILGSVFLIVGFQMTLLGLMADTVAASRTVLEEIQLRKREEEYR